MRLSRWNLAPIAAIIATIDPIQEDKNMNESTPRNVEFPINWNSGAPDDITSKVYDDIMDDFDMTPAVANDNFAPEEEEETEWDESEEYEECSEAEKMKKLEKAPRPLTRLEAHVLRSLVRALSDADAEKAEEMLGILAEHPDSIRRVLEEFKHIKEASDDLKTLNISWEQGTDRNNQQFVRVHMTRAESKTSSVEVVIGSDGRNQALRRTTNGRTDILPMSTGLEAVRPVEALRQLSVKQELLRQATERRPQEP